MTETKPSPAAAVVGPFSGPRAPWGELLLRAAEHHGVGLHWDFFDDRGDAQTAAAAAETIVREGRHPLVIGHFNSAGAAASLPLYREHRISVLLPLSTAPGLLEGNRTQEVLRWCPDDRAQLAELCRDASLHGYRRLLAASDGSTYGDGLMRLLEDVGTTAGSEVARSFRTCRADEALVICGTHHGAARVAHTWWNSGGRGAVYVTDDCAVDEFPGLLPPRLRAETKALRLRGGAASHVDAAFAAARAALLAEGHVRGGLGAAVRERADRCFSPSGEALFDTGRPGWEVVPVERLGPSVTGSVAAFGPAEDRRGYDAIVAGAGVMGSAVAAALARQGARVAMTAPAPRYPSATAYSGGLVRAYDPDPFLRALAIRSHRLLWGAGSPPASGYGFRSTGSAVLLAEEDLAEAERGLEDLHAAGIEAEFLSPEEARRRFPAMAAHGVAGVLWEPGGGYADPLQTADVFRRTASDAGAVVLPGRVTEIFEEQGGVRVGLEQATVAARTAVLAAGGGVLGIRGHGLCDPGSPVALRTKRIKYAFFAGKEAEELPSVMDLVTGMWGRPQYAGNAAEGYLVGRPVDEWDVPAEGGDRLSPEEVGYLRDGAARRWPWIASSRFAGGRYGVDLFSPGGPVLGPVAGRTRTVGALGWSGSGFKLSPAAAEQAAESVLEALG